jgi:peptide-methionine (S)-S-oxide reductase
MRAIINILSLIFFVGQCSGQKQTAVKSETIMSNQNADNLNTAIFAGGCFWCTEAVFQNVKGVYKVESGYIGGTIKNPAYREITTGRTGHAEAIRMQYNESEISFAELLEIFFATHDPTTLNRQGNDVGTQYRSEIFFTSESQQQTALEYIDLLNKEKVFSNPIVTKVSEATVFYVAEDYHQNYYNDNSSQPYCRYVIVPKLEKLQSKFSNKLRKP